MKKTTLLFSVIAVMGGLGSAVLGACSSDDFATGDAGPDVVTVDAISDVGRDADAAPVDAGPQNWCALNARDATACADFDGVDATSQLLPFWFMSPKEFGVSNVGPSKQASFPFDGGIPSSPNQLNTSISKLDGSQGISALSTQVPAPVNRASFEFSFVPPTSVGGPAQVVELARVGVISQVQTDSLLLQLVREGNSNWQLRGTISGGIVALPIGNALTIDGWHRAKMVIDGSVPNYQLYIDGKAVLSGPLTRPWTKFDSTVCQGGPAELNSLDLPISAPFDNLICNAE